jgi:mannosyltransferase OCH1-like enzyme
MIPKILHFMSANGKLSPKQERCIDSFVSHNPELKIMHWTDSSTTKFINENYDKQFYSRWINNIRGGDKARGKLKKWDSARLYILNKIGGIWTDSDCTCLKPLNSLLGYSLVIRKPIYRYGPMFDQQYNFKFTPPHICNAFFATEPNNEIINEIIDTISIRFKQNPLQNVATATACLLYGQILENRINNKSIGDTRLLEHYEFKEGPEKLEWIDKTKFKDLFVVHKLGDYRKRYISFPQQIQIKQARNLY